MTSTSNTSTTSTTSTTTDPTTGTASAAADTGADTTTGAAGPLDDPRPAFARAAAVTRTVISAIGDGPREQLDRATPCEGLDVRELLRHLHMALRRAAVVTEIAPGEPLPVEDHSIADDELVPAIDDAIDDAIAAWRDDARLTTSMTLPWMSAPGAAVLSVYLNEAIVHTWDLARATNQDVVWDPADAELALTAIVALLPDADRTEMWERAAAALPAEYLETRGFQPPFADAVTVDLGADAIERLVAWNGRQP